MQWTRADAIAVARRRLDGALERLRALGADVVGEVGDPSPIVAIGDVLRRRPFDTLILSTLPVGPSQWLRHDVPTRIERLFNLPVELVTPPLDLTDDEALETVAVVPAAPTPQEAVATP